MEDMKAVILCGGKGTRIREESEFKPKPMVRVGNLPILWHIMKNYSHFGVKDFVLCLGYKGEMIKNFFFNHEWMNNDITIRLGNRSEDKVHHSSDWEDWKITFADTGQEAMTGARIKKVEKYLGEDNFFLTYGDGLSDVDIPSLLDFHNKQGTTGTLTAVHPHSNFGMVKEAGSGIIERFVEKPVLYDFVNGGFYCFKKEIFDYLHEGDSCTLETEPLNKLVGQGQLSMFKHEGFWHAMDTYKDYLSLNEMWGKGERPWKVWG
jgi:glucose-1-phosphate cytidylyltransferase